MELQGKVIAVLNPREGTSKAGNPWKAQEYVIETVEQYSKKMCFEVFGAERIAQYEPLLQLGNNVKVSFDIDARQWNDRWFNSIRAWNVTLADDSMMQPGAAPFPPAPGVAPAPAAAPAGGATAPFPPAPAADAVAGEGSADDLPF